MSSPAPPTSEPLLRTLAAALRLRERSLRTWLDMPPGYPRSTMLNADLEGVATELRRRSEDLDVDRPLMVIMLMGGTGVGKSTLLNALAGASIANASFARPTTRDPVVYYHESIRVDRLDPALRQCRLAAHDRGALEHKVLVDTPDLDSNELANRDTLLRLLPVADVVLYVGSQEKYHDKLGWDLFLQQRQRRAFAFVLNKWDRCVQQHASGLRPDEDMLRDLQNEGFVNPQLFRTCAQQWVEHANGNGGIDVPDGEEFQKLVHWLEIGLTRLEIEAIKARGVSQLLDQLMRALEKACPPDLTEVAAEIKGAWESILAEEGGAIADVLLNTLEPYQREIEHHFTVEGQRRFQGLMAAYLHAINRMKYLGSTLRDRMSFVPKPAEAVATSTTWNLATFTRACSSVAGERHLDARGRALANRLLLEADKQGFPLQLLTEPTEKAARMDWRQRYAQDLIEVLQQVEQQWATPSGVRRHVQTLVVWVANWVPSLVFLGALLRLLWVYFMGPSIPQLFDVVLPFVVLLIVLILLQVVIALVLPLRWPVIRNEFRRRLERHLQDELENTYATIPAGVVEGLQSERKQVEQMLREVRDVADWLQERQQKAGIEGLYGH